jgi:hypothetical protein
MGGVGGWGYVDSLGSTLPAHHPDWAWDYFYVSDAVRADGSPANLGAVHFIKVHTGRFKYGGLFGEISTEIYSADYLGQQSDFPLP